MQLSDSSKTLSTDTAAAEQTTERLVLELESEGTDFHTVFKNQQVNINVEKDLLISSIVTSLAIRGFDLKDQVISYFSRKEKTFVAAAKRPISAKAVIPSEDIEKNGRLTLKIWPSHKLPEALLIDLNCQPRPRMATTHLINALMGDNGGALLEATLKSSNDGSVNQALLSLSSGTSVGKELRCDNTLEQILGKIERSRQCERKEVSNDSFAESQRFRK